MARILYAVQGDARGHVSRSAAVAGLLSREHEFLFIGGGKVAELAARGYNVEPAPMLATIHANNRVDFRATVAHATRIMRGRKTIIRRIASIIREFDPHLILVDYEFFTPRAARLLGRPCVSLDHQHILTHCRYDPPPGQRLNRLLTCSSVRWLFSAPERHIITSFFDLPPINPRATEVVPPILGPEIFEHEASVGDYGLVYVSGVPFAGLKPLLGQGAREYVVYGMSDTTRREGNLLFKPPSRYGFLADLAACRHVITNGGHSLISEALHYKKPVLCFPIAFLYEQFMNAWHVEKLGYGRHSPGTRPPRALLADFEQELPEYDKALAPGSTLSNEVVTARLEQLIGEAYSSASADASASISR